MNSEEFTNPSKRFERPHKQGEHWYIDEAWDHLSSKRHGPHQTYMDAWRERSRLMRQFKATAA